MSNPKPPPLSQTLAAAEQPNIPLIPAVKMEQLQPHEEVLRNLLYGLGAVIFALTVAVFVFWITQMPPRPALDSKAEVMAVYREEREANNDDAEKILALSVSSILLPSFTALIGFFIGKKVADNE